MSELNFGEQYFATRDRIHLAVEQLYELAQDTHTDLSEDGSEEDFKKELAEPFQFLVFGEINAGKSTFLNALFQVDVCPTSPLPETHEVISYQFSEREKETRSKNQVLQRFLAVPNIQDFVLIDTPGTNTTKTEQLEIAKQHIPAADLIFFVFPVTNPWGASTWNLLSQVPEDQLDRTILVVQQADQLNEADLKIILQHLKDLSMKRIGRVPEIFSVSGKDALQVSSQSPAPRKKTPRAGFAALERYITSKVFLTHERLKALQDWRERASSSLTKIEDQIEEQTKTLGNQNSFLASLEDEIDAMRESLVIRLPDHLAEVAENFDTEAEDVTKALKKHLSVPRSVFRIFVGDRTGAQVESFFIERLRQSAERLAESDGKDIVATCQAHWKGLGKRVEQAIGGKIDDEKLVSQKLENARLHFVGQIGSAAQMAIGELHVRKELEKELRRRNRALKSFTASTLIFLIAGATCGFLGLGFLPAVFCGIAALFAFGGAIIAIITKKTISEKFRRTLLNTCGSFAETLRKDYEDALRGFFQEYATCLNSIRKHLVKEKIAVEPRLKRWHELFLTLKSIEQDI